MQPLDECRELENCTSRPSLLSCRDTSSWDRGGLFAGRPRMIGGRSGAEVLVAGPLLLSPARADICHVMLHAHNMLLTLKRLIHSEIL